MNRHSAPNHEGILESEDFSDELNLPKDIPKSANILEFQITRSGGDVRTLSNIAEVRTARPAKMPV
jgi:hypothetical protein